MIRFST